MRILDRLSEKQVKNAKPKPGKFVVRLADGGGLYLQATVSKAWGINRNWIFRYELDGARHDMGLGPLGLQLRRGQPRRSARKGERASEQAARRN